MKTCHKTYTVTSFLSFVAGEMALTEQRTSCLLGIYLRKSEVKADSNSHVATVAPAQLTNTLEVLNSIRGRQSSVLQPTSLIQWCNTSGKHLSLLVWNFILKPTISHGVLLEDDELTLTTRKSRGSKLCFMKEVVGKAGIGVIFPAWQRISA